MARLGWDCLGAALRSSEAKRIYDTMRNDSETLGANILEERLKSCEHASCLASGNLLTMPMQTLRAHVAQTRNLWPQFPVKLQVTLAERQALEAFHASIDLFQKKNDDWRNKLNDFIAYFDWGNWAEYVVDASDFQADSPRFSNILDSLLSIANDHREESLMLAGFMEDDGSDSCAKDSKSKSDSESDPQKEHLDEKLGNLRQAAQDRVIMCLFP